MNVYRCKFCNGKYFSADMLMCEECYRNEFLKENLNIAPPESSLPPLPETMNSRSKPHHPIGEVNVQVLSDSPFQREQREAQMEVMTFSHEDSTVNNDSEASNFFYQHISPISEHGPGTNTSFQIIMDILRQTQSSLALGNEAEIRSNFNCAAESTSSGESPQNLMNFYDPQSNCNREIHPSIEMITEIIKSLQIKSQDSQLDFPVSSASTSDVSHFVPENVIIHYNASGTQNKTGSCFPGLFNSSAHSTENFFLQQDAHYSETQTTMEGAANFSVLRAPPVERSASPTPKPDFECEICQRKFTDELSFAVHKQTHERRLPFKCDPCDKEFKFESALRRHYVVHMENRPFKCSYCDHASKRKSDLNEHIRHRHKSQLSSQCPRSDLKYKWKCEKCSKRFRLESKFDFHVRNKCVPNPFKCDQCSLEFPFKSLLQIHYRVHTGEKPFKCDQCPYASSQKSNLKKHEKTHH